MVAAPPADAPASCTAVLEDALEDLVCEASQVMFSSFALTECPESKRTVTRSAPTLTTIPCVFPATLKEPPGCTEICNKIAVTRKRSPFLLGFAAMLCVDLFRLGLLCFFCHGPSNDCKLPPNSLILLLLAPLLHHSNLCSTLLKICVLLFFLQTKSTSYAM